MGAAGEQVEGVGFSGRIALFAKSCNVSCQRGGVAGDVDDAAGGHLGHGLDHVFAHALSRRVDDDDVGPDAFLREALRGLAGVGAEEFGVCDMVCLCVFLRILNRGVHDLHAVDLFDVPGKTECDRAAAAVKIQRSLRLGESGKFDGFFIEPLGLVVVDLIKRRRGEAEGEAEQPVCEILLALECFEVLN